MIKEKKRLQWLFFYYGSVYGWEMYYCVILSWGNLLYEWIMNMMQVIRCDINLMPRKILCVETQLRTWLSLNTGLYLSTGGIYGSKRQYSDVTLNGGSSRKCVSHMSLCLDILFSRGNPWKVRNGQWFFDQSKTGTFIDNIIKSLLHDVAYCMSNITIMKVFILHRRRLKDKRSTLEVLFLDNSKFHVRNFS